MVKINPVAEKVRTQMEDVLPIGSFVARTEAMQHAFEWGKELHQGQIRLSGEPYFECHCGWVASFIDYLTHNEAWTIAALLHDTIEDQNVHLEDIRAQFPGPLGEEVATIVDGTTKLITSRGGRSKEIETLRKIATFRNPAVFLIKLADRTHNMLTLGFMPRSKQLPKAEEAIRAYGRLAGILNCYRWRCWLEDLAFPFYQPETYEYVRSKIDQDPRISASFLNPLMEKLAGVIEKEGLSGEVSVVVNGYWRAWLKLKELARNRQTSLDNFANVNDLISFRLTIDTEDDRDCYRLLAGINRFLGSYLDQTGFDDYIAIPQNGYRALQVSGWFENYGAIEVAIASREMEGENMWGIVYNLQHNRPISHYQPVTILTPTGGLRFVEEGATVLDAVASIQQDYFLDKVTNVEVNGNLARLSDRVQPGDVIEVITGDERMVPSENWLSFASRSTIPLLRSVLVNQELKREADAGRKIIRSIIIEHGITDLEDVQALEPEKMDRLLGLLASPNLDDLYAAIGGGAVGLNDFMEKLEKVAITRKELGWSTIYLDGPSHANQPGVMAHLAGLIWQANGNILRVINNTYPNSGYEIRIVTLELSAEQKEIVIGALLQLKNELGLNTVQVI